MKLYKSTILAMLGMAVALTSCSDDDNYNTGENSPGAYFAEGIATEYYVTPAETSFKVPVMRTQDGPSSYDLTSFDESGLFTIPKTVTFANGETTTDIVISFDSSKLEEAQPYAISLIIGGQSKYGDGSVNITVSMQEPMVTETFEAGVGTYTYYNIYSGDDPDLPISISYMPANPNKVQWSIGNWGGGTNLVITCEDFTKVDANGRVAVDVPLQFDGEIDATYNAIYVGDVKTYLMEYLGWSEGETAGLAQGSYYLPEKGTFFLDLIYFVPYYNDGQSYLGDFGYETFQMDGYPDYNVTVVYDGMFTDRNQQMTAKSTIECGADVAALRAIMIEGDNATAGYDAIVNGGDGVQDLTPAPVVAADFEVETGGTYTIVAVSFDNSGEAIMYDYDTFQIVLGTPADEGDWEDYGTADFADGWIIGAFSSNQGPLIPMEWAFPVDIQLYTGEDRQADVPVGQLFRMIRPYGNDFPLIQAGVENAYPVKRNIEFIIEDVYFGMLPQPSGFGTANWKGELVIGNYEGYLLETAPGATVEDAVTVLKANDAGDLVSSYEDYVVTVPMPMFGAPGIGTGDFGYNWSNVQPSNIIMPEAPESVRARVKAARLARPTIQGAAATARIKSANSKTADRKLAKRIARKVSKRAARR